MVNGDPAKVYVPEAVPTYTLYPARSGSPFAAQVSVALPVVEAGGGGVDGGGGDGGNVDGAGGGVETTGVGACNSVAKDGLD